MKFFFSLGASGRISELMRLYLAEATWEDISRGLDLPSSGDSITTPLRVLMSFAFYKDEEIDRIVGRLQTKFKVPVEVFADSGAYSAATLGMKLSREDYVAWVRKWRHLFTVVAAPDVIGNPERTLEDTLWMRERIPEAIPTYHVGSPLEALLSWKDCPYIALGGMVPYASRPKHLGAWLTKTFRHIPPTQKVHGFGMTRNAFVREFPWYSCDSSSWGGGYRWGMLRLFSPWTRKWETVELRNPGHLANALPLLKLYNLPIAQCRADELDRFALMRASIQAWRLYEQDVTSRNSSWK